MRETRGSSVALRASLVTLLFLLAPISAPAAAPFIYWVNAPTAIGRANIDGSAPNQSFLTGMNEMCGVAVDGAHIYWTDHANGMVGAGTIGRANLDGSSPEPTFITGASNACGIAVDGGHIYWTNDVAGGGIGRANLDGSSVNQAFIPTMSHPCGVAVDGAHVYWTNRDAGTIGRANLDGSGGTQSFIAGGSNVCGVAVDGAHVYWANRNTGTIGRADIDGGAASVNQSFVTGAVTPCGVGVDAAHVYWGNDATSGTIGRGGLDGTGVNQAFIIGATFPCWIATDVTTTPTTTTTTTTAPGGCGTRAATFASIDCRLDALITDLQAATDLKRLKGQLVAAATAARDRKLAAEQLVDRKRKKAKSLLKIAAKKATLLVHKLNSRTARKDIPDSTRGRLLGESTPIAADMKTLLGTL